MIAVTGGGTGGHIFPCIAVIDELRRRGYERFLWIGQGKGLEELWARKIGVPFYGIRAGKLRRYLSLKNAIDGLSVLVGVLQCMRVVRRARPLLLFSKGGFVSVPPVIAARMLRVPVVTHESDIIPGLATRIISRFASMVCVSFQKTLECFPGRRTAFTGNPVRKIIREGDREAGAAFLRLDEAAPVVLVVGGSSGASRLNAAVWKMREKYRLPFVLVHLCGEGNLREGLTPDPRYRQYPFIGEQMGDVIAASDIVVSRAGAGALSEFACLSKPAVLVPLPKSASRGEQIENAGYFQEHGAAVVISNRELNEDLLFDTIQRLLADRKRLKAMGASAHALTAEGAEKAICDILESFLGTKRTGGGSPRGQREGPPG
jgi:UDP-N-acetylglucosamine--N-acetylmuramyl-(pentapeptide) pyrophosphoryl-undecaprenol N-acetylglucosamine transferase